MSSSYMMTMPILIYNLGAEMVYVLCSRLRAQQIPKDKSCKVIYDVVNSLFDKKFIYEIQKKQEIAKHVAVRQLFDKLVHSSIMRLNTSSMNKLFDLMLMSVKLQFIRTKFPEEVFQITMNHLNCLISILTDFDEKGNAGLIEAVKENIAFVNKTYIGMSPYDYVILKQTLLRFFQGKNVKVSIFIQDGTQSSSGVIFLPMHETAPPAVKQPGLVTKYDNKGSVEYEYKCPVRLSALYQQNKCTDRVNIVTTELGGNIYVAEKRQNKTEIFDPFSQTDRNEGNSSHNNQQSNLFSNSNISNSNKSSINVKNTNTIGLNNNNSSNSNSNNTGININKKPTPSYLDDTSTRKENIEKVKKEFGYLADLLNVNTQTEDQIFKLDLFRIAGKKQNFQGEEEDDQDDFIEIERENKLDKLKNMFDDIDLNKNNENDDDLLDLMDMAANK